MNAIDIVLSVLLLIGVVGGFSKGFIKSVSGFIGIVLAIWIGFNFSNLLEGFVSQQAFIPTTLVKIASLILTIILIIIAIKIISKILHEVVHGVGLGFLNRIGGAVFGLLINLITLSAIIYYILPLINKVLDPEILAQSQLIPYLLQIAEFMKLNIF